MKERFGFTLAEGAVHADCSTENEKFGFTLAEVLITLGIIGVVAAMTMPTLINQTNGAQYRAAFKKELSVISQAVTLNEALDEWNFADLDGSENTLSKMLKERTNVISDAVKDEDYAVTHTGAESTDADLKAKLTPLNQDSTHITFNDGSMFIFDDTTAKNCTEAAPCVGIFDVNGIKKPNKVTECDDGTSTDDANCYVKIPSDVFPVKFYDHTILPASAAGRAVLSDKTKKVEAGG